MKKLVIKFNARLARNPMTKIEEMTTKLGLKIESIEELKRGVSSHQRVVSIVGDSEKLQQLDKRLDRYASVTRKAI